MFESLDRLKYAVYSVYTYCKQRGYPLIEMDNRLKKKETQDVVFKIQIKGAICELQLARKQDETQYHWTHCIYEI